MKKLFQHVVLVAVAMLTAQSAMAEEWRINNDASKGAHFASINEAMASEEVKDGDVLYLDPGCLLTDVQTISKAVTVIGTGWEHSDMPFLPAVIDSDIKITNTAKIIGVHVDGNVLLYQSNVLLNRCKLKLLQAQKSNLTGVQVIGSSSSGIEGYSSGSSGWSVCNSYISSTYQRMRGCVSNLTQATITNCFMNHLDTWSGETRALNVDNSTIKNNIIVCTKVVPLNNIITGSNNTLFNNCLSADETSGLGSSNVCTGVRTLEHYVINAGEGGAWMQLCEGSPAIGAGEGGIDCGPYAEGSLYPFVTYGMPQYIPYFTEAVVPSRPTDGKVKVSLKIVNQNK